MDCFLEIISHLGESKFLAKCCYPRSKLLTVGYIHLKGQCWGRYQMLQERRALKQSACSLGISTLSSPSIPPVPGGKLITGNARTKCSHNSRKCSEVDAEVHGLWFIKQMSEEAETWPGAQALGAFCRVALLAGIFEGPQEGTSRTGL